MAWNCGYSELSLQEWLDLKPVALGFALARFAQVGLVQF
jgi:hypothetical protein